MPRVNLQTAKEGSAMTILGETEKPVRMRLGHIRRVFQFHPVVVQGLTMPLNISGPFLQKYGIDQINSRRTLRYNGQEVPLEDKNGQVHYQYGITRIHVLKTTIIPPHTAMCFPGVVKTIREGIQPPCEGTVVSHPEFPRVTSLIPAPAFDTGSLPGGYVSLHALNPTSNPIRLSRGQRYGFFIPEIKDVDDDDQAWDQEHQEYAVNAMAKRDTHKVEEPSPDPQPWTEKQKREWVEKEFRIQENTHLTQEQKEEVIQLLMEFWSIYSTDGSFGKTHLLKHAIYTQPVPPIKCRFRPINPSLEASLKQQLEEWLKHDIIEVAQSPWSFCLVPVKKKNGQTRWCVDYRKLNDITMKDAFPLPSVDDNLSRLADSEWFSGIDGMGAFHVVEIEEKDRQKTAFATPWNSYQFKRMPFGLSNGPATYSRLVQLVLQGIPPTMALPYLDDTIVHSHTFKGHVTALRKVLEAHAKAGLKLQPSKCDLFKHEIDYLGHRITKEGIKPIDRYTAVVREWPMPSTRKELRAFLGKVGYYRRFIRDYSAIACPLTEAIKKEEGDDDKSPIQVTQSMRDSFEKLKQALVEAPILAYPRFDSDEPFILDTDWSQENKAIGGVLSQVQNGEERVICYGAKKLNSGQSNYPPTKGELCAAVYFMRLWKYYLLYRPFVLRTDHRALQWINKMENPTGMISRWLETLASFRFDVKFRPGKQHANADALSRIQHGEEPDEENVDEDEIIASLARLRTEVWLPSLPGEWKEVQMCDDSLRRVRLWVENDNWPDKGRELGPVELHYWGIRDSLFLDKDGVLFYRDPLSSTPVPCIPRRLQPEIIKEAHQLTGHRGIQETLRRTLQGAYFPKLKQQVQEHLRQCTSCQLKEGTPTEQRHTPAPVVDGYPFQRISIDFVGPLPESKNGNKMLLTIKDTFTRWIEAFPIKNATAEITAQIIEREIIARHAYPESIHSDQGRQFTSELLKQVANLLDIRWTMTPAYNPKSNPVERSHKDLKNALRALTKEHPDQDWEEVLPQALFAARMSQSAATGLSPFQLLFGRDPSVPLTTLRQMPQAWGDESCLDYVKKLRDRIHHTQEFARKNISTSIQRQCRYYRHNHQSYQEGDQVWLFTPPANLVKTGTHSRKLDSGWTGPWAVKEKVNDVMYIIEPAPEWNLPKLKKPVCVGIDRLKVYYLPKQRWLQFAPCAEVTAEEIERHGDPHLENFELEPLPEERTQKPEEDESEDEQEFYKENEDNPSVPPPAPVRDRVIPYSAQNTRQNPDTPFDAFATGTPMNTNDRSPNGAIVTKQNATPTEPIKRKRGRPRKQPFLSQPPERKEITRPPDDAPGYNLRPRGRPIDYHDTERSWDWSEVPTVIDTDSSVHPSDGGSIAYCNTRRIP